MKNVVVNWVEFLAPYLPAALHQKLTKLVQEVPEVDTMLHGDYHIKNVMLQNGECLLIDMDTICHGHPVFELGSMYNAYQGFSALDHNVVKDFLGISYETGKELWRKSLALYLGTKDEKKLDEVEAKAQVIGFTRLLRRSIRRNGLNDPKEKLFIQYCQDTLAKLLPALDTLTF
jgi:5-methylthioribose kinase